MSSSYVSILIMLSFILLGLLPSHVFAAPPASPDYQTAMQGEIAYVLDGDIWLHDLATGKVRQLTTDGNNQLPAWSPDGRYLTYSSGYDLESSDLYLLDIGSGESRLLAEDACCAAWEPEGKRIAFLAVGSEDLSLDAIDAGGENRVTLLSPLTWEGEVLFPAGRLRWHGFLESWALDVPVEVIKQGAAGILGIHRDVLYVEIEREGLWTGSALLTPTMLEGATDCAFIDRVFISGYFSAVWTWAGNECPDILNQIHTSRAIGLPESGEKATELPWLSAPDFSPNNTQLVAERYLPSDDPLAAPLWGVVVYDVDRDVQTDVAEGASQPAWRPGGATADPVALSHAELGEYAVTIDPPLHMDGVEYQVSYFTTSDLRKSDASLFSVLSPEFIERQQITGFAVNADGKPVTDPDVLRQVFTLYPAAYALYEEPPGDLVPTFKEELDKVIANPLIWAMEPEHFLSLSPDEFIGSRRSQTAEALRALLTDDLAADPWQPVFDKMLEQNPTTAEDALEAINGIVQELNASQPLLDQTSYDLKVAYTELGDTIGQ